MKASNIEIRIEQRLARIEKALGITEDEPLILEPVRTREEMKSKATPAPAEPVEAKVSKKHQPKNSE